MSADIVYFSDGDDVSGYVATEGAAIPAVCAALRTLLEEAEAGKIRAIGFAIVKGFPSAALRVDAYSVTTPGSGWALECAARRLSKQLEG